MARISLFCGEEITLELKLDGRCYKEFSFYRREEAISSHGLKEKNHDTLKFTQTFINMIKREITEYEELYA